MTLATRIAAGVLSMLLVMGVGTLATGSARAVSLVGPGTGTTGMPDQVLRRGCRAYAYTYALAPTTGDWMFESYLVDPDGHTVSAGVLLSDSEANPGSAAFGLCRGTTRYGRFTIIGRLTTYDGWEQAVSWITPTTVRLHRSRRR